MVARRTRRAPWGGAADRVVAHLLAGIERGRFGRGDKLPSRSVLAKKFKVSLPTVTAAFRTMTRQGLVEFVPGKGVFVAAPEHARDTRPFTIGLIGWYASHSDAVLSRYDGYWQGIFKSLIASANRKRCAVSVIPETDREPLDVARIAAHRPDVLISHGIYLREETIAELRRAGIPFVLGNRHLENQGVSYVDYDTAGGFRRAVRLFHARGHRRMACLVSRFSIPEVQERCRQAFCMELVARRCSYAYADYWRVFGRGLKAQTLKALNTFGDRETRRLLDLPEPPSAVYCFNPAVADGAARAAAKRGLRVGESFSILVDASSGEYSPYSMLRAPHEELGARLVETAQQIAAHPEEVVQRDIAKRFLDRGSIARLRLRPSRKREKR